MEVLDLLLTFQFNSRLESFIAKFKTADLSSTGQQRGARSLLCPLLAETFDPFDQSKYATVTSNATFTLYDRKAGRHCRRVRGRRWTVRRRRPA